MNLFVCSGGQKRPTYEVLTYLQTGGGQYIDTGVSGTSAYGFEVQFSDQTYSSFDTIISSVKDDFTVALYQIVKSTYFRKRTVEINIGASVSTTEINTIVGKDGLYVVNGKTVASIDTSVSLASSSRNIYINTNTSLTRIGSAKYYYLKLYGSNNTLIRDFIPVIRIDETLGFYDRVNQTFYENDGTGEFIAGAKTGEKIYLY